MSYFRIGGLQEWVHLQPGETITFPGQPGMPQEHRFDLVVSEAADVIASDGVLVASREGGGRLRGRFSAVGTVEVIIATDGEVFAFRPRRLPQLRAESDLPSFTVVEPRRSGPSDDLRRMMHMVRLNSERREATLRAEIAALSGRISQSERRAPASPVSADVTPPAPVTPE